MFDADIKSEDVWPEGIDNFAWTRGRCDEMESIFTTLIPGRRCQVNKEAIIETVCRPITDYQNMEVRKNEKTERRYKKQGICQK